MSSKKLGYRFYPKDWRSDDVIILMNAEERDAFRFIIDECFIKESNEIQKNYTFFRKLLGHNSNKLERIFKQLFNFNVIIDNGDTIIVPSVTKRLCIISEARTGGEKSKAIENKNAKKPTKYNIKENKDKVKGEFENFWDLWHELTGRPKEDKLSAEKYFNKLSNPEKQKAIDSINDFSKTYSKGSIYFGKARTYLSSQKFNNENLPNKTEIDRQKRIDNPMGNM